MGGGHGDNRRSGQQQLSNAQEQTRVSPRRPREVLHPPLQIKPQEQPAQYATHRRFKTPQNTTSTRPKRPPESNVGTSPFFSSFFFFFHTFGWELFRAPISIQLLVPEGVEERV